MCQFFSFSFDPKTCEVLALFGADRKEYSDPDSHSTIAYRYSRDEDELFKFELEMNVTKILEMKKGRSLFDVFNISSDKDLLRYYDGGLELDRWSSCYFDVIKKWQQENTLAIIEAGEQKFNIGKNRVGVQILTCPPNTMIELDTALSLEKLSIQLKGAFCSLLEYSKELKISQYFTDLSLLTGRGVMIRAYTDVWNLWTYPIDDDQKQKEGASLYRCRLSCKNFIDKDAVVMRLFVNKYIRLFVSKRDGTDKIGKECRIVVYPVHFVRKEGE